MKKRITALLFALILFVLSLTPVFAATNYIFDECEVLLSDELTELNKAASEIYERNDINVAFLISDNTNELGTIGYAEKVYTDNFGDTNGILLFSDSENNSLYIFLAGNTDVLFSEDDINIMYEAYQNNNTYAGGIKAYLDKADYMISSFNMSSNSDTVSNTSSTDSLTTIPDDRQLPRLVDNAELLTQAEKSELLGILDEISTRQQCDVAVVTVNSLDGKTATEYADDFYDYNGYGMGSSDDGIMFLISMDERQWAISTYGFAIEAFTDKGQEYIMDDVKPYLSNGDYAIGFKTFAKYCDDYITQAKNEAPYDNGSLPDNSVSGDDGVQYDRGDSSVSSPPPYAILISLAVGLIVALIVTGAMRSKLKSVRRQAAAADYLREGSLNITRSNDIFLYSHVSRVERPTDNDSGSSIHTSSSGRSHGGSSGGF